MCTLTGVGVGQGNNFHGALDLVLRARGLHLERHGLAREQVEIIVGELRVNIAE